MSKFKDWVMDIEETIKMERKLDIETVESKDNFSIKEPLKKEIKKIYKKKPYLKKNVMVYKPILPFERKDIK